MKKILITFLASIACQVGFPQSHLINLEYNDVSFTQDKIKNDQVKKSYKKLIIAEFEAVQESTNHSLSLVFHDLLSRVTSGQNFSREDLNHFKDVSIEYKAYNYQKKEIIKLESDLNNNKEYSKRLQEEGESAVNLEDLSTHVVSQLIENLNEVRSLRDDFMTCTNEMFGNESLIYSRVIKEKVGTFFSLVPNNIKEFMRFSESRDIICYSDKNTTKVYFDFVDTLLSKEIDSFQRSLAELKDLFNENSENTKRLKKDRYEIELQKTDADIKKLQEKIESLNSLLESKKHLIESTTEGILNRVISRPLATKLSCKEFTKHLLIYSPCITKAQSIQGNEYQIDIDYPGFNLGEIVIDNNGLFALDSPKQNDLYKISLKFRLKIHFERNIKLDENLSGLVITETLMPKKITLVATLKDHSSNSSKFSKDVELSLDVMEQQKIENILMFANGNFFEHLPPKLDKNPLNLDQLYGDILKQISPKLDAIFDSLEEKSLNKKNK